MKIKNQPTTPLPMPWYRQYRWLIITIGIILVLGIGFWSNHILSKNAPEQPTLPAATKPVSMPKTKNTTDKIDTPAVALSENTLYHGVGMRVNWVKKYPGNTNDKPANHYQYLIVNVTVKNRLQHAFVYGAVDMNVWINRHAYPATHQLKNSVYTANQVPNMKLDAGQTVTTNVIAEIPANSKKMQLKYSPDALGNKQLVSALN